jgi:ankyrin repeat protein/ribosomal protein S21
MKRKQDYKKDKTEEEILKEIRDRVIEEDESLKQKKEDLAAEKMNLEVLKEMTDLPVSKIEEIAAEVRRNYQKVSVKKKRKKKDKKKISKNFIFMMVFFIAGAGIMGYITFNIIQSEIERQSRKNYRKLVQKYSEVIEAVNSENLELLEYLITKGAPVDVQGYTNDTALMIAVKTGNTGIINFLLDSGADVTMKNNSGKTALDLADEGSSPAVQRIIGQAFAQAAPEDSAIRTLWHQGYSYSETSFIHCVREKNLTALSLYVQADDGIYANNWDDLGIKEAAQLGFPDVLSLLLDKGKDIDSLTVNSALLRASKAGMINTIEVLLTHDADINFHLEGNYSYSEETYTPLMKALLANNDAVAFLLEEGADPDQMGGHPAITPLMVPLVYGRHMTLNWKHVEHISLLIRYGADVNKKDADKRTALSHARYVYGKIGNEIERVLIEAGAE